MQPISQPPPDPLQRRALREPRRLPEGPSALAPARPRRGGGRALPSPCPPAPGMHAVRPFPPDRVGAASAVLGGPRHLAQAPRAGGARLAHQDGDVLVVAGTAP